MANEALSVLSRFNNFVRCMRAPFVCFPQIFFIFCITNETFLFAERQISFMQYSRVIIYNFLYLFYNVILNYHNVILKDFTVDIK